MSFSFKTNNFLKSLDVNKNGISAAETKKILLEKVLSDWESGVEPGYAKPVTKPSDFEKWKFFLQ